MFLWDVAAGVTDRRLPGHMGKINVVDFNEDATVLASGGWYKSTLYHPEFINVKYFQGSFDATVRLWDLRAMSRAPIQVLEEARDAVQTIHVGPTFIITGSVDGHVRTYDLRKGELRADYIGRECPPTLSFLYLYL